MTTINQQIEFIQEVRDSHDNNQREVITTKRTPEAVAELLRDIHENLLAVRLWQTNHNVELCRDCNQPAKANGMLEEALCDRCAQIRIERLTLSPNGTL